MYIADLIGRSGYVAGVGSLFITGAYLMHDELGAGGRLFYTKKPSQSMIKLAYSSMITFEDISFLGPCECVLSWGGRREILFLDNTEGRFELCFPLNAHSAPVV
jgi:hypothetical protein